MRIKKIALQNVGPYIGNNSFEFDVSNRTKNMVLIGGKNGAGKTTLFKAIKVCLYGCVAFGFETNNSKYFSEIEQLINTNEKLKKVGKASVVIDLLFDDGMYDRTYTFVRKWEIKGKKITEEFLAYKDGAAMSETEKGDFKSYLLQLLPPNMFRFYFFDGERISDFIFSGNKTSDFKEAFLKLCNLDTMEIIKDNFQRLSRSRVKKGELSSATAYDKSKEVFTLAEQRVTYAEEEYESISREIIRIDEELAALEKNYSKGGGISKKEWQAMQAQIAKEEIKREETRKWLKDTANNVLPFVILKEQLIHLKEQMVIEYRAKTSAAIKSAMEGPEINELIESVLRSAGVELSEDISTKIISEIKRYANTSDQKECILNLSDMDRFELTGKINGLLAFDTARVKNATNEINASLKCVKRIRRKMEKSSIENYDVFLQKKSDLNELKSKYVQQLLEIDKELQVLRSNQAVAKANMAKARAAYEQLLKKQSINDISARALLAFDELQKALYIQNIKTVETGFHKFFLNLINKSDLIDGIHIDDNLNVLPYKNKRFNTDELKKVLEKNGPEYIIAQIGIFAYEILQEKLSMNENEIVLPVEVKQQLSAGEKQIFIMALYQALSQLNKINVPYIIDTPFARIDKEHRGKILEQFFKKLSGQVIILSTDEEIVSDYFDLISDATSNTFILSHTINGSTKIIPNTYFER